MDTALKREVDQITSRWPTVGLAFGVVRDRELAFFHGHGLADIATRTPVTADTVFRIASITKTFTAVAIMQLWERGLVDLDAPASEYLRSYRLVPARPGFAPPTLRHLLTHTAGIREVLHPWGLTRMRDLGETVPLGRPVPKLARYYRGALRVDAQPGTRFAYTNHGFATLGQIVADVTGIPLDQYLRVNVFDPLGMHSSDLVRSSRVRDRLAIGYELRPGGAVAVADYDVITTGGGAAYCSANDLAAYLAALLGGGTNWQGSVLKPATTAALFEPQYQPDPRIPGIGLAFFRIDLGGHQAVEHDGILPGFDAQIIAAPSDGVAVLALANGAKRGMHWLAAPTAAILRGLIGALDEGIRPPIPQRPDVWGQLCGRYRFSSFPTDPQRLAFGLGAEVLVRRGRLMMRFLSPIPVLYRGFDLHPDDESDPYVFRVELPVAGMGSARVVFSAATDPGSTVFHFDFAPMTFRRTGGRRP
ncbi:MAG TPA: serine hydrolase domain-containing protein [Candidatus Limnocylindrales bacterium]|nr:serine hydrolase domain-containing protein [Candidatus Limnocylindrales bacterium]